MILVFFIINFSSEYILNLKIKKIIYFFLNKKMPINTLLYSTIRINKEYNSNCHNWVKEDLLVVLVNGLFINNYLGRLIYRLVICKLIVM